MLLARLAARAVEVGVDLGHRAGVVDVGGWMVGIVVVAGSSREVRAQSSKLLLNLRCSASVVRSFAEATCLGERCESGAYGRQRLEGKLKVDDRKFACGDGRSGIYIDVDCCTSVLFAT